MRERIAIVGAGVSGLVCAYLLHETHDVVVYEASDWIGGHTHTVDVRDAAGVHPVDTGFIVFNDRTYPSFLSLLKRLGVATRVSEMSFSVHDERNGLEWNGRDLGSIFVQKRNLLRPSFYGMLRDVLRFNREARALASNGAECTLGEFLDRGRYGRAFRELYVIPMGSAIWSTDAASMLDFPARFFARFFENHGMLEIDDRPQWYVIDGGSRRYVEAMTAGFRDRIRLETPVASISRQQDGVSVHALGSVDHFDHVILASHADQSLAMLTDADPLEREVLGAIPYSVNETTLHQGRDLLPLRQRALASWNYRIDSETFGETPQPARVTYHMNTLQSLQAPVDYCVSLGSHSRLLALEEQDQQKRVLGRWNYEHPLFTPRSTEAVARWSELDGRRRTHFVGAYWRNGFHEDGVWSALRVCEKFGRSL